MRGQARSIRSLQWARVTQEKGLDKTGNRVVQRLAQVLNRAGGVPISAGLERVLPLQLQQRRDVDQHFGYLVLVHVWNMVLRVPGSKPKISRSWPGLMTEPTARVRRLKAQERRTSEPRHVGCYAITACALGPDRPRPAVRGQRRAPLAAPFRFHASRWSAPVHASPIRNTLPIRLLLDGSQD